MLGGWEGNERLQDAVRRVDSPAQLIAEFVSVDDSKVKSTKSEWAAADFTGSVELLTYGGAKLLPTESVLAEHISEDGTETVDLTTATPFDALIFTWSGSDAENREFHTLTARVDPRADGGLPKTCDHLIAQVFRVVRMPLPEDSQVVAPIEVHVELIAQSAPVSTPQEVPTVYDFTFAPASGRFPRVGPPPEDALVARPMSLVRILAYQADGQLADNVAWLSDGTSDGTETDSLTYSVTHYSMFAAGRLSELFEGGTVWDLGSIVSNMPYFSLSTPQYAAATITFDGPEAIPDIPGTGELVIVARGEEWGDSSLDFRIWDGASYVSCADGDLLGQDNRETVRGVELGGDLSGVPVAGPWNLQVLLTPSTSGFQSPVVLDFGIERRTSIDLGGIAEVRNVERKIDPLSLKPNIPTAEIAIRKTGERDFRDYGTELLVNHHTGPVEIRVYVGDPTGEYLHRSEWMLKGVWGIEDYFSDELEHVIDGVSKVMRRLRVEIPPFVVTSGNDGERKPVLVSGTRQAVYDEILDSIIALPARFRGPGVDDTTSTAQKLIQSGDGKDTLDQVLYLGGEAAIESQGRLKVISVLRDEPIDYIVARFPIGSYVPLSIGPGFSARTDEFFVPWDWDEAEGRFIEESIYFNATALDKLGGAGLDTTGRLGEETAKWITAEALADAIGRRVPKHFGNGLILWQIEANERNPQLELGDYVIIETDLFVARSPLNNQRLRGRLSVLAMVARTGDEWGQRLDLWVPGFEYITVSKGTVDRQVGPQPTVRAVGPVRAWTTGASGGDQYFKQAPHLEINSTCKSLEVSFSYPEPRKLADQPPPTTLIDIDYSVDVSGPDTFEHVLQDGVGGDESFRIQFDGGVPLPAPAFFITIIPYSEIGGAAGTGYAGRALTLRSAELGSRNDATVRAEVGGQDLAGHKFVAGTGVSIAQNAAGDFVVSSA